MRAVKSVSGSRVQKIQEDLIAAAKKETAAAVDPKAVARIGKEENLPTTSFSPPPGRKDPLRRRSRRSSVVCRRAGVRDSPTFRKTRPWSETSWSGS